MGFVTVISKQFCSLTIERHESHQVVMAARPTILSERGTHAYKQLIRETFELQGFCLKPVEKKDFELLVVIEPDLRYHLRFGVCGVQATIETLCPSAISVMYRSVEST